MRNPGTSVAIPSRRILAERSSPSRVRFAAPNSGAPLTAAGRSADVVVSENSVLAGNAEVMILVEIMLASTMNAVFVAFFALVTSTFHNRAELHAEILALRHQLAVLQRNAPRRLCLKRSDRLLWILLARFWSSWRSSLQIVQPATVLRWQRRAFVWYWARKARRAPGRPELGLEIRDLIRRMSQPNPCGEHPAFTENCSSWESRSRNRRSPNICCEAEDRPPRLGEPSCGIM